LLAGCEIALDRTPIGSFVEIEQVASDLPAGEIERICLRLGLDPEQAELRDYLTLWRDYRAGRPELPKDMVFERVGAPEAEGGEPE